MLPAHDALGWKAPQIQSSAGDNLTRSRGQNWTPIGGQLRAPFDFLLARVVGITTVTADMLVQEVLSRRLRDRRALARYAGLTGSPDESGARRREKGLARSVNPRVRLGMVQLAWRFLWLQKDSALARWYRERTEAAPGARKTMIIALARKLLIALWRLAHEGVVPEGLQMRAV